MSQDTDDSFFDRADAHIHLANDQIGDEASTGQVSASLLYSAARFNAWVGACSCADAEEMGQEKSQMIEYFSGQFRQMLEANIQDYIDNFTTYMGSADDDA